MGRSWVGLRLAEEAGSSSKAQLSWPTAAMMAAKRANYFAAATNCSGVADTDQQAEGTVPLVERISRYAE